MPVVGLTGGIASGKSTVARFFAGWGAVLIDADEIAKQMVRPDGPAYQSVLTQFGERIVAPDGSIQRDRLAEIVFGDAQARRKLEEITHPHIFGALASRVQKLGPREVVVVEAALLLETLDKWQNELKPSAIVMVFSSAEERLKRLTTGRLLDEEAAFRRIQAQGPWEEKVMLADYVLYNTGSLEDLKVAAAQVWESLTNRLSQA